MKIRWTAALASAFTLILGLVPTARATHQGFDQAIFEDTNPQNGVADGWTDTNQWDNEFTTNTDYRLSVDPTTKKQLIRVLENAGHSGNMGIGKTFSTTGGAIYSASTTFVATVENDPDDFFARLTFQPRKNGTSMGVATECNADVNVGRDVEPTEPPLQTLTVPECPMPAGADQVRIKVRVQIRDGEPFGTFTIHEVSFHHVVTAPS